MFKGNTKMFPRNTIWEAWEQSWPMRPFIKSFIKGVSSILITSFLLMLTSVTASPNQPNVLFLFTDQHQASAMGNEGHPDVLTPNLDQLAAQGVTFSRAYCNDAVCGPSRMSIMTGLYPRSMGVLHNPDLTSVLDKAIPLALAFKEAGYATGAFGKRHLAGKSVDAGWDIHKSHFDHESPGGNSYIKWVERGGFGLEFAQDWAAEFGTGPDGSPYAKKSFPRAKLGTRLSYLPADKTMEAFTAQESIAFMREQNKKGKPFFCWSSFYRPHQPYNPQAEFLKLYDTSKWGKGRRFGDGIKMPESLNEDAGQLPELLETWRGYNTGVWCLALAKNDPQIYRDYIGAYYALVTEIDYHIGQIVAMLKSEGMLENTIIVYSTDHGDFVGNHGMVEKCATGHNIYEDTLRVPLIFYWKGKTRIGLRSSDLTQLVDIYPTLMELCGLQLPKQPAPYGGRSLTPTLLDGQSLDREFIVSENWSQTTIIGKRFKYGRWNDTSKTVVRDNYYKENNILFDRNKDPLELTNLVDSPEYSPEKKKLISQLDNWEAEHPLNLEACKSKK